jgi:hypothetical protein
MINMAEKIDNLWDEEHEGYPIGVIGKDPSSPKERVIILDHSPSQVPDYVSEITIKGNIIKIRLCRNAHEREFTPEA